MFKKERIMCVFWIILACVLEYICVNCSVKIILDTMYSVWLKIFSCFVILYITYLNILNIHYLMYIFESFNEIEEIKMEHKEKMVKGENIDN